jgi:hypothetical protein
VATAFTASGVSLSVIRTFRATKNIGSIIFLLDAVECYLFIFTDMISDVAMAKRGFPRTGVSACFGGPLFSILCNVSYVSSNSVWYYVAEKIRRSVDINQFQSYS